MAIDFQVRDFVRRLDLMAQRQVPYAAEQTLKRLGYALKQELGQNLQQVFGDPIPLTVASPRYTAQGLELRIRISDAGSKGSPPSSYLFPATTDRAGARTRKPSKLTGLGKYLRATGAVPDGQTVMQWYPLPGVPTTSYGNAQPGFVSAVMKALGNTDRTGYLKTPKAKHGGGGTTRYFVVRIGDTAGGRGGRGTTLAPGVYRAQGQARPERLFAIVDRTFTVPTLFDFEGVTRKRTEALLPGLLAWEIRRAQR